MASNDPAGSLARSTTRTGWSFAIREARSITSISPASKTANPRWIVNAATPRWETAISPTRSRGRRSLEDRAVAGESSSTRPVPPPGWAAPDWRKVMEKPFKGRLAGHELLFEGQPCGVHFYARNGNGLGKCSCGELSELLPTNAARQRWHRQHKADIAAKIAHPRKEGER